MEGNEVSDTTAGMVTCHIKKMKSPIIFRFAFDFISQISGGAMRLRSHASDEIERRNPSPPPPQHHPALPPQQPSPSPPQLDSAGASQTAPRLPDNSIPAESSQTPSEGEMIPQLIKIDTSLNHRIAILHINTAHLKNSFPEDIISKYKHQILIPMLMDSYNQCNVPGSIKTTCVAQVKWSKPVLDSEDSTRMGYYPTSNILLNNSELEWSKVFDVWCDEIRIKIENENAEGSGFTIERTEKLFIEFAVVGMTGNWGSHIPYRGLGKSLIFNPMLNTGCIFSSIAAFKELQINPQARDSHLHAVVNREMESPSLLMDTLDIRYDEIPIIEKNNLLSIYVYVKMEVEDMDRGKKTRVRNKIVLARKGGLDGCPKVKLLLIENRHFVLIKDFNRFLPLFLRKKEKAKPYYCPVCFAGYDEIKDLEEHESGNCTSKITVEMPQKGSVLKFKNVSKAIPIRYTGWYDFEVIQVPEEEGSDVMIHKALNFAYIITDRNGVIISDRIYTGEDCVNVFIDSILKDLKYIKATMEKFPLDFTEEARQRFESAKGCFVCKKEYSNISEACRHHDHSKKYDNYLFSSCNSCNLQMDDFDNKIHFFAHGGGSYDMNLILKECTRKINIDVLPKTSNTYHRVTINNSLVFMDTRAYLNASLAKLADGFIKSGKPLIYTNYLLKKYVPPGAHQILSTGKQICPYSYLDSFDRLKETSLPPKDAFYNTLTQSHISNEDYEHCVELWELAECKTLNDFINAYLLTDIGYLCDVFTDWRSEMFKHLELDPLAYVSLPGVSFDSMIKTSGVELELIHDRELYETISSNVRGGLSGVFKTMARANNEYCPWGYDLTKPKSFITFLDANALYSTSMSHFKLPTGGFRELNDQEKNYIFGDNLNKLQEVDVDGDKGYFLLIDTFTPPEVAVRTENFPLMIHHQDVTPEMISPHTRRLIQNQNGRVGKGSRKLIASHLPQSDHLITLRLLQLLVTLGLVVRKVSRVWEYNQSFYMKDFIDKTIDKRIAAGDPSVKNMLKLALNSIFGKTLYDVMNCNTKVSIVSNMQSFQRRLMDPFYQRSIILNEKRVITISRVKNVVLNSPIYIGYTILELAKYQMYRFYYNFLHKVYGKHINILYQDTDSLLCHIETPDFYNDLRTIPELRSCIDTSNFPSNHPAYSSDNAQKLGFLKSETADIPIVESIALRSKCYSLLLANNKLKQTAKGIPFKLQENFTHEMYKDTLINETIASVHAASICCVKGQLITGPFSRIGLSPIDDKKYYINGLESLFFGHPHIPTSDMNQRDKVEYKTSKFRKIKRNPDDLLDIPDTPEIFRNRNKVLKQFIDQSVSENI